MIQDRAQLIKASDLILEELRLDENPCFIQKISGSAWTVSLHLRIPGQSFLLCLGRGHGREGVLLEKSPTPAPIRQKDQFVELMRANLVGARVAQIGVDRKDRILQLTYQKWGQRNELMLFWKGRQLYFALKTFQKKTESFLILRSWRVGHEPIAAESESLFEIFDEIGRKELEVRSERAAPVFFGQLWWNQEVEQLKVLAAQSEQTKRYRKTKEKIERDLKKLQRWKMLSEHLMISHDGIPEGDLQISGNTIPTPSGLNPFQRRDFLFEKAKKWRSLVSLQEKRLAEFEKKELKKRSLKDRDHIKIVRPVWNQKKTGGVVQSETGPQSKKEEQLRSDVVFIRSEHCQLALGKSATANQWLRSHWAKKDDIWVHIQDRPSAHVFLKLSGPLEMMFLSQAANMLARHHKLTYDLIPILYTRVRFLRAVKDRPGTLNYRKEKRILISRTLNE